MSEAFSSDKAASKALAYDGRPLQVLALDGGGYRGLFTAQVIADWEARLGKPIGHYFDVFVGTSTGGILALGLAAGVPATELVKFYVEDGKKIFPSRWSPWRWLAGLWQWLFVKYGARDLEAALEARLPKVTLGDLKKPVVIPSFNLETGRHWFFKTTHIEENLLDGQRLLWQVARATGAAPSFFSSYRSPKGELFIDGGVVANNPSLVGYFEVQIFFPAWRDNVKILNIGTEGGESKLPSFWLRWGGLFLWAKAIPAILMQAQAVSTVSLLEKLLGKDRWMRVNPENGTNFRPLDVYEPELYQGIASQQAARFFTEANEKFFQHQGRTNLVPDLKNNL